MLRKEHCLSKNVRDKRKIQKSAFYDGDFNSKIIDDLLDKAYNDDLYNRGRRKVSRAKAI